MVETGDDVELKCGADSSEEPIFTWTMNVRQEQDIIHCGQFFLSQNNAQSVNLVNM